MKFPQGEGSAVIHRKKNDLLYKDMTFWLFKCAFFIFFFILIYFFYREFALVFFHSVRSGSVLYSILYSILCSLQNIFFVFCLFVRSLSSQLFFLVVLLLLLLRKTAFSFFSSKCDFFPLFFLSHITPSSFLEWLSSEQFAELGSVQLLAFSARAYSLAFLSLGVPFLAVWYI